MNGVSMRDRAGHGLGEDRLWFATLGAALLVCGVALAWYVVRTYSDVVFLDGLQLLFAVDDFLGGRKGWSVFFIPYSEHRLPLYLALLTLNTAVLGLDMRLDPALSALASLASAALLASWFRRSAKGLCPSWGCALATLPVIGLAVSLVAPPMLFMATQFHIATVLVLAIGALALPAEPKLRGARWAITCAAIIAYFLFCSGGYFPGLLASLALTLAVRWGLERRRPSAAHSSLFGLALACAAVYTRGTSGAGPGASSLKANLEHVVGHPVETAKFFVGGLAASVIDVHSFQDRLEPVHGSAGTLAIGSIVALFVATALVIFVRARVWERTYLPVWLLAYAFGVMLAVRVGRADYGWKWMMNEWYSFHLKFIPIAVYWILCLAALTRARRAGAEGRRGVLAPEALAFVAFAVFTAGTWVYANRNQLERSPHVKHYLDQKREALRDPGGSGPIEQVLLVTKEEADRGIAILRARHLNVFRGEPRDDGAEACTRAEYRKLGDWHEDGWIGRRAVLALRCCPAGRFEIRGRVPADVLRDIYGGSVSVDVLQEGAVVARAKVAAGDGGTGTFVLRGTVSPRSGSRLELAPSRSFVPREYPHQPADSRELSVIVEEASCM